MKLLLAVLVAILAIFNVATAQFAFGQMPGGMGMMGGGPYGAAIAGGPYGGNIDHGNGGGGWGRRRMMGSMMNPYMGMMYGR